MKKTIILFSFTILAPAVCFGDYNQNYQEGYKQGYQYNNGGIKNLPPIPPITPLRNIGENEQDGYARGILEGHQAREDRFPNY
jgi:hypothetical protein